MMSLGFAKETVRKGLAAHTALGLVCCAQKNKENR